MKYFLDTEFIEGFKKPIKWLPTIGNFNKPYHSIQLISIGIVCGDGREYYAISKEFNWKDASDWVKTNVLFKILKQEIRKYLNDKAARIGVYKKLGLDLSAITIIQTFVGKSNKRIADEVRKFCLAHVEINKHPDIAKWGQDCPPEFYAYYADYDWVVFCSLFGTMMDLPKAFPMYCKDLKQMVDEEAEYQSMKLVGNKFEDGLKLIKNNINYPKQHNEHNALDDAKWNLELYIFLKTL